MTFWLRLQNYNSPLEISDSAFIFTSFGAIFVLMILYYIMMEKRLWENLVISVEPNLFFLFWSCFAAWSWYPLIWGLAIWWIVRQNIQAEKKKMLAKLEELVEENDYLTEDSEN